MSSYDINIYHLYKSVLLTKQMRTMYIPTFRIWKEKKKVSAAEQPICYNIHWLNPTFLLILKKKYEYNAKCQDSIREQRGSGMY